jgi:hypothetical protein
MMLTQTVLGLVLLGQVSATFAAPFLAMQGWIAASRDGE